MYLKIKTADPWLAAPGQARARPLSETLQMAWAAAADAGVTRLADVSGLAPFGIPVFQAVRPRARLLSVSQGKGLTAMAAMVSALLEAVEQHCAETIAPAGSIGCLADLGDDMRRLWNSGPRSATAITLDPDRQRRWLPASNLSAGGTALLPWDMVSLDFSRPGLPDAQRSTVGLATGNNREEACVAAVGELIEHDLQAVISSFSPRERRAAELDLASIADPLPRALIARIQQRGFAVRVWAMGQDAGIAAFRCVITDIDGQGTLLPPAGGTACHPDRSTALLRAVLEAVQSRITLIAGARDDLDERDYGDGVGQTIALIMGALSFGPGTLPWSHIPHDGSTDTARQLELLLEAVARRSSAPVLLHEHAPPDPGLCVVHAFAPALADPARVRRERPAGDKHKLEAPIILVRTQRPIVFVGPSVPPELIPDDVEVRPPARCGDLAGLIGTNPPAVGLIDGCFETAPTVWHKEMLDLVAHGIPVAGGASLGALRAAETWQFGVIGVGTIFEMYRDGAANRDDAVMVSHAPPELGHRPLTVALVDMEAALLDARIDEEEKRILQRIARCMDFRERSWRTCLDLYRARTGRSAALDAEQWAALGSLKQCDALQLIDLVRAGLPRPVGSPAPPRTSFYELMLRRRAPPRSSNLARSARHALPA